MSAKRGTAAIFGAKLVFMAAGYVLYAVLGRMLTPAEFGVYGVVIGAVSLVNMVVINGTLQTVAHFVAKSPGGEESVRRRSMLYQAVFAAGFLGLFYAAAPLTARLLNDVSLTDHLRFATMIPVAYAFYAVNVGALNGRQIFVRQAALDVFFSTTKVAAMSALVGIGLGIPGAIGGFAAAALLALLLSFAVLPRAGADAALGGGIPASAFARFAASALTVALVLNGMVNADLFLLKSLSPEAVANERSGLYTAAQSIARIPWYLMMTASLVLFPKIASLHADDERTRLKRADTSSRALTAVLALLAGMVALTAPIADRVVRVLYPESYAGAGPALAVLIAAMALLTLANVTLTMVSGAGAPSASAAILLLSIGVQAGLCAVLVPRHSLVGAALSTLIAAAVAFGLGFVWLHRRMGTRLGPVPIGLVVAAAGLAALAGAGFGRVAPGGGTAGKLLTVGFLAAAYTGYLGVVAVLGVLTGGPSRERRVLLVTKPLDPPFNDGSKVFARALARRLDPRSIAVCTARRADGAWPEDVEVLKIYSSAGSFAGRAAQNGRVFLFLLLERYRFRAIHFFFAPNRSSSRAVRLLRAITFGVPFVQTVLSRPARWEEAKALLFGDVITAGSDDAVRRLREHAPGRAVELVRPGIELDGDRPAGAPDRETARARLGLEPGQHAVLFAGDLDHGGAPEHLARIVPALLEAEPRLVFLFSVRVKGPATMAVADRLVAGGLARFGGRVRVHVDHPAFLELVAACDAMVLPCDDLYAKLDAPLVAVEAMALGKPVFVLDRPPVDELAPPALREALVAPDDDGLVARVLSHARGALVIPPDALVERVRSEFDVRRAAARVGEIHGRL